MFKHILDGAVALLDIEEAAISGLEKLVSNDDTDFDENFIEVLREEGLSVRGLAIAALKALSEATDSEVDDALVDAIVPTIRKIL